MLLLFREYFLVFFKEENFKFKYLSLEELIINLDRLTRFKLPDESYNRVFFSILQKNLISPKFSKAQLEKLNAKVISKAIETIWNKSVKKLFPERKINYEINRTIKLLINLQYKNLDENTISLIKTKLSISPILEEIDIKEAPNNLKLLIHANKLFSKKNKVTKKSLISLRKKLHLTFPTEKLLIVEGITEEILLPVFARKMNKNFEDYGIFVLGAGGKSKSPELYIKLKEKLKIPVILLFDNDAKEICELLQINLLKKDKTIIIDKGEFEDIISLNLLKRAINKEYGEFNLITKKDLQIYTRMCQNIENYFKSQKLGEFKKAKFAKIIAKNIKYNTDISIEVENIIKEIIRTKETL